MSTTSTATTKSTTTTLSTSPSTLSTKNLKPKVTTRRPTTTTTRKVRRKSSTTTRTTSPTTTTSETTTTTTTTPETTASTSTTTAFYWTPGPKGEQRELLYTGLWTFAHRSTWFRWYAWGTGSFGSCRIIRDTSGIGVRDPLADDGCHNSPLMFRPSRLSKDNGKKISVAWFNAIYWRTFTIHHNSFEVHLH